MDRVEDRSLLRFPEQVSRYFSFLEPLGFVRTQSGPTLVRFESPGFDINVYHGRQSFEIGLEIRFNSSPEETFSFYELLRLVDREKADRYRNYATHTPEGVAEGVRELSESFRSCVEAGDVKDGELRSRLQTQREELADLLALKSRLPRARQMAETAWRKEDYASVVEALKPIESALTPSEIQKLRYAETNRTEPS